MNTMTLTFDTLQYAKKLQKAGFTEQQAEIQAETFKEQSKAINEWIDNNLATKRDLKELDTNLKHYIKEVEERLTMRSNDLATRIKEVEERLTMRSNDLATRIKGVEERMTIRINEMSYKLTIKLGSMIAGAVVILGVLIPIMLKFLR